MNLQRVMLSEKSQLQRVECSVVPLQRWRAGQWAPEVKGKSGRREVDVAIKGQHAGSCGDVSVLSLIGVVSEEAC